MAEPKSVSSTTAPAKAATAVRAKAQTGARDRRDRADSGAFIRSGRTSTRRPQSAPAPENITFSVELPAAVHTVPEHEVALSIDDVAVDPGLIDTAAPGTTSMPARRRRDHRGAGQRPTL